MSFCPLSLYMKDVVDFPNLLKISLQLLYDIRGPRDYTRWPDTVDDHLWESKTTKWRVSSLLLDYFTTCTDLAVSLVHCVITEQGPWFLQPVG